MEPISKLELIVEEYFEKTYKLYKPNDANGEEIDQWFEFKSRADFLQSYLDFYRNLPTLKSAIINGCCAKFKVLYEDKEYELKHTHQEEFEDEKGNKKGVNNVILTDMAVKLVLQEKKLKNTKSFEDVYQIVKSAKVPGFGELSIYDSAVRISAYLGFTPSSVYLHAGTSKGAKSLEEKGLLSDGSSLKATLPVDEFPEPIQKLETIQIENFLCSFKNDFKKI